MKTGSIKKISDQSYHVLNPDGEVVYNCVTSEYAYYIHHELNKCNWDTNQLDNILKEYPKYYTELLQFFQYIHKDHQTGNYKIVVPAGYTPDNIDHKYFLNYNNLEDVLWERDFLMENGWDYDVLVENIDDGDNIYYDLELPPFPSRRIPNPPMPNYHEKELLIIRDLILEGYNRKQIGEKLSITPGTVNNYCNLWGVNFRKFKKITLNGDNPLEVLNRKDIIIKPDLTYHPPKTKKPPIPDSDEKYIYANRRSYSIRKKLILGCERMYTIGRYNNLRVARVCRDLLVWSGWDVDHIDRIENNAKFIISLYNFVVTTSKQ